MSTKNVDGRQNMKFEYAPIVPERICGKYKARDLGLVQLDNYPIDGVYDWGNCILKIGDTYKMWWTRACPQDTIWYAESKDLKHWSNEYMVFKIRKDTEWIKGMLGWSDVLYVDGTYYMFFEAPATIDRQGEYNNNVFVATSSDGKNFTMYPSNEDPQPILKTPEDIAKNKRTYGIGQPDVFYKDGEFWLYYTDAATEQFGTRVVHSPDPFHFDGEILDHPMIMNVTGLSVRYSTKTGKYYTHVGANPHAYDKTQPNATANYLVESEDGIHFEYNKVEDVVKYCSPLTDMSVNNGRGYADFVTNAIGQIDSPTLYLISKIGQPSENGRDHRTTHNTWDCFLQAVNTEEFADTDIMLPNGKPATDENLGVYRDLRASWQLCSIEVPAQNENKFSEEAIIESVCYNGSECEITPARGSAAFSWDENYFYIKATVTGTQVESLSENCHHKDGITVFLQGERTCERYLGKANYVRDDLGYEPLGNRINDTCAKVTICADGSSDCDAEIKTEILENGYVLNAKIHWPENVLPYVKKDAALGLDLRINVALNGKCHATVYWSDYAAYSDLICDRYGEIVLK